MTKTKQLRRLFMGIGLMMVMGNMPAPTKGTSKPERAPGSNSQSTPASVGTKTSASLGRSNNQGGVLKSALASLGRSNSQSGAAPQRQESASNLGVTGGPKQAAPAPVAPAPAPVAPAPAPVTVTTEEHAEVPPAGHDMGTAHDGDGVST